MNMSNRPEPLKEAMDSAAQAAGEATNAAQDLSDSASSAASGAAEEGGEAPAGAGGFEERVEDVVSKAGNFMARDITEDPSADSTDRTWGLIAYISQVVIPIIAPVLMLVIEPNKDRPFQRFHAVQSLGFVVAVAIYEVAAGIVYTLLSIITLGCLAAILWILFLLPVVPAIYYAYLAYQGRRFDIPYLTKFMRGQGWL
jgi:uncharacterized membrane protein